MQMLRIFEGVKDDFAFTYNYLGFCSESCKNSATIFATIIRNIFKYQTVLFSYFIWSDLYFVLLWKRIKGGEIDGFHQPPGNRFELIGQFNLIFRRIFFFLIFLKKKFLIFF